MPRYSEPGTWTADTLVIYDRVNNRAIYSAATLQGLGIPTTVTVLDMTPDLVAPQLTSIAMIPTAVDVSPGPVNVQVDLTIVDSPSGLSQNYLGFDFAISSPSGGQALYVDIYQFTLISGNVNAGVWRANFQMPRYAQAGVWKVTAISLRDAANNRAYYYPATLSAFGSSINLSVVSAIQDLTSPSAKAIRFTPAFVNTSLGPQSVQVEMDTSDEISGVRLAPTTPNISWIYGPYTQSPSGVQYAYVSPFGGWSVVSGDPLNGTWRGSFTLPQYSEEGTWAVQNFRLEDEARNTLYLSTRQANRPPHQSPNDAR